MKFLNKSVRLTRLNYRKRTSIVTMLAERTSNACASRVRFRPMVNRLNYVRNHLHHPDSRIRIYVDEEFNKCKHPAFLSALEQSEARSIGRCQWENIKTTQKSDTVEVSCHGSAAVLVCLPVFCFCSVRIFFVYAKVAYYYSHLFGGTCCVEISNTVVSSDRTGFVVSFSSLSLSASLLLLLRLLSFVYAHFTSSSFFVLSRLFSSITTFVKFYNDV